MKKSELTYIIRAIVAEEIRKELPRVIAEVFQGMLQGKSVVSEQQSAPKPKPQVTDESFKTSLRELFTSNNPIPTSQQATPRQPKKFTSNPILNEVLNNTVSDLRDRERLVGAAAFAGGYSPSLDLVPGFNPSNAVMSDDVVEEANAPYLNNIPTMPGSIPVSTPPALREGQESTYAPLSNLPNGISALDVKNQAPPAVKTALTRNYSQMMKIIDAKRKGKG